ncbi:beta strand repeat-containing protein, partial [uncultured Ruegeria sp.]|uniref:beta strand repeat-containing protein n=1 Tax=uncultured Ruegeria sp. TaxID=259304 RepID=UPI00345C0163
MTIENFDIQPALRLRTVLVRGGRLTKFKGHVASIAPGLFVVASAAVLFSGGAAQASECGADTGGQTSLTCNSSHNTANGITYTNADGLNLTLPADPELTVGGSGVRVQGRHGHNRVVMLGGSVVATADDDNHGIHAELVTTDMETELDVLAQMVDGNVEARGADAYGLYARSNGNGRVEALVQGGTVISGGHGAIAKATGNAEARVELNGKGSITTTGANAMALFAQSENAASNVTVTATVKGGATITTDGRQAHGALASNKGNGDAYVVMEGAGTRITTNGANKSDGDGNSYGLWASVTQFQGEGGFGNATAEMKGGNIRMNNGSNAYAVYASIKNKENEATATARLTNGSIRTMTHRGYGLFALTNGTGETAAVAEILGGNIRTNVNDDGNNAYGLWAYLEGVTSDEARAIVRMAEEENVRTTVRTSGSSSFGIVASTTALGHVEAQMEGGTLITDGALAHGAFAWIYGADNASTAVMNMTGGEIETSGDGAYGIAAEVSSTSGGVDRTTDSTATATVNMSGGEIETSGADARGIVARSSGLGAVSAQMSGGRVTTVGQESHGLVAQITNAESNAAATVGITGGKVRTVGHFASGLWATTEGVGNATAEMKGGTVRTYEAESHGLFVEISNAGSAATATANITDGEITTEGGNAHGVYVVNLGNATAQLDSGKAIVNLGTGAVVAASGTGADGIRAEGARGFDVDVAGTVTGGSGNGAAIRTISSAGGTIDIASTARVTAGTSGLAIQDGDGDAVITSAGTIVGDVRLGAGDDRLTLAGGSVTGGVDGGAGGNDHLTLSGQIRTTLDNFINWEHLTLKDGTNLRLDGTDRLDMDLSIDAGSVFHVTGGGSPTGATIAGDVANASGGGITIRGGVTNSGTLSVQDGDTDDVITIEGDYTGSGSSVVALDTVLDSGGPGSDRLVIT